MTILVLRGHIRSGFSSDNLYHFVSKIYNNCPDLKIYIHTWNIIQNNVSWRQIEQKDIPITNELIFWYFKDLSCLIKHIIIDDDSTIILNGRLKGDVIPESGCWKLPIIGWKRYWYGKYKIIKYLYETLENKNEIILNCRFDVLCNSNSLKSDKVIDFINCNIYKPIFKNIFLDSMDAFSRIHNVKAHINNLFVFSGIDNFYLGNIETQYKLAEHFHLNLDNIVSKPLGFTNHEYLVPIENDKLFNEQINMQIT